LIGTGSAEIRNTARHTQMQQLRIEDSNTCPHKHPEETNRFN
jgi:hypothetical protein